MPCSRYSATGPRLALNEGRGANPGDTSYCTRGPAPGRGARSSLNEGRGANPGDTVKHVWQPCPCALREALNEGRGANPGDTLLPLPRVRSKPHSAAQRRPGREPRRHLKYAAPVVRTDARRAQRRPGREPRRHAASTCQPPRCTALNEGWGANPGDTAWRSTEGRSPDRSTKAGARTPATRPTRSTRNTGVAVVSLNEGRGANPGDTRYG